MSGLGVSARVISKVG